jgi:hypothetical protein
MERLKGSRDSVQARRDKLSTQVKDLADRAGHISEARELLSTVALETQEQLRYHISEIVTLAMDAVLDDPYELEVDFVPKRGKTECELWFSRDGERMKPLDATGGGAVDIAAFALRVALWTLRANKTRNTLVLDEPFKHLRGEHLNRRAIQMVREISQAPEIELQVIMVCDEKVRIEDIEQGADSVVEVTKKKGKAVIRYLA